MRSVLLFPAAPSSTSTTSSAAGSTASGVADTLMTLENFTSATGATLASTTGTSTAGGTGEGMGGRAETEGGRSTVDSLLFAGLASACIVLIALVLFALFIRRRSRRMPPSSAADLPVHTRAARPSRGPSRSRVSRSTSRPSLSHPHRGQSGVRTAYGETSLATDQYAETSLYPQPYSLSLSLSPPGEQGKDGLYGETSLYPQANTAGAGGESGQLVRY